LIAKKACEIRNQHTRAQQGRPYRDDHPEKRGFGYKLQSVTLQSLTAICD
jgi:hypothetical protein